MKKEKAGTLDEVDEWIRMVATTRLVGHSKGFFSVYSLPGITMQPEKQRKMNKEKNRKLEYRNVKEIILQKTAQLLRKMKPEDISLLRTAGKNALFLRKKASSTSEIKNNSVSLTVTSPPFLDVVKYGADNWLRCWFNGIDAKAVDSNLTFCRNVEDWLQEMKKIFAELFRITKPGGYVAFEVGEVRNGTVLLDEHIIPLAIREGFSCVCIIIHRQKFAKMSHVWGIKNNLKGTNTNRVVVFNKAII